MRTSKYRLVPVVLLLGIVLSCDLLDGVLEESGTGGSGGELTEEEVVSGLRTALSVGIDSAASQLSRQGGYYLNDIIRILLPGDVVAALDYADTLKARIDAVNPLLVPALATVSYDFGVFDGMRDSLKLSINRAAEHAAPLSVEIFKDAIASMTIQDGMTILTGDTTAATSYLQSRTYTPLTNLYSPFVDSALSLVGAHQLWTNVAVNYNGLTEYYAAAKLVVTDLPPLPFDSLTTDLAAYTTQEALDGLFWAVGEEEARIRRDPVARVNDILETVFGWLEENS